MAEFDGHLYAGTANPITGGELWKTRGGDLPYHWTKVFDRGAGRGLHNEVAGTLCEFKGALYVASGVINGGYHRAFRIGPAAAEIMRFWPDDSRSEEHTSELQSLMRISYAVFCLKKKKKQNKLTSTSNKQMTNTTRT